MKEIYIVSDLDGTLLNSQQNISIAAKEKIKEFKKKMERSHLQREEFLIV